MIDERTEEDKIIEILQIEGEGLYEDTDFIPSRQSLYEVEDIIPSYDEEAVNHIVWRRPEEISENTEYFIDFRSSPTGIQGTLSDETFLGTLLGVCSYLGQDLIQDIIASRPEDFKNYGVFTCRFYVEGEWVDVITDTRIPCFLDSASGDCYPAYGRSPIKGEMWICLIEKAYAKAVGSYEALQKVKVNEALLHLTGGSVQQLCLHDEVRLENGFFNLWKLFKTMLSQDTLILALPANIENSENQYEENDRKNKKIEEDSSTHDDGIVADRLYSVLSYKEVGAHDLVMVCNPWGKSEWTGEWSESSVKWDDFPEVYRAVVNDPKIVWRRDNPQGFIWMSFREFLDVFNTTYMCKIFSNEKFKYYCVKGEWKDRFAGGPMNTVRDKDDAMKSAIEAQKKAEQKPLPVIIVDGDASWFNNPQYRVTATKATSIFISITPYGNESDNSPVVAVDVVSLPRHSVQTHLWDCTCSTLVASEKVYSLGRVKGQEASIWSIPVDPKQVYYIVPHTMRRGLNAHFILRVHSLDSLTIKLVSPLQSDILIGEWRRSGDSDTTGGPLFLYNENTGAMDKENSKWCQNPQFHLQMKEPFADEELYIKIVARRTDKLAAQKTALSATATGAAGDKTESHIGIVLTKAESLDDKRFSKKKGHGNGPRKNAFGEVITPKASSLKRAISPVKRNYFSQNTEDEGGKVIVRKTVVQPESFVISSTYSTRNEACIYLAKVPRSWLTNGFLVVPCLSEKGSRGSFELEVYCSEPFTLKMLQDSFARSVAGEWTEGQAGGSHICPTWKKNPRFNLKLRSLNDVPVKVNITITRHGATWKSQCHKDSVGSMIGFYIFVSRSGEWASLLETAFVPTEEVTTADEFVLEPLGEDEYYTIMPTTFSEGHLGAFILSVSTQDCEFTLMKDTSQHHSHK